MRNIEFYRREFLNYLSRIAIPKSPKNLYEPAEYILQLGGKRVRPVLTLISTALHGGDYRLAFDAATAIELFHNFSLVHDDIMDEALLRRGKPAVHQKWDRNTAILSGDALLVMSYKYLDGYDAVLCKNLLHLMNTTALQVCEGQQLDIDFEKLEHPTGKDYLEMISKKTAVLLGCALKTGALIAETDEKSANEIYDFGLNLGLAFQLQDDYLDAFGDEQTFGKKTGGDILANKKTFLFIKALENSDKRQGAELLELYGENSEIAGTEKIKRVTQIFRNTGSDRLTIQATHFYTQKALDILSFHGGNESDTQILTLLAKELIDRKK